MLWRSAAGGVGVAEGAGPLVVAAGEGLVGPSVVVVDVVVVAAEWSEVGDVGGSALGVGGAVVEVAVGGGAAASGEGTGAVSGFDVAALRRGGSPAGGAVGDDLSGVGVGDGVTPFGVVLVVGDLAGDVGDDRSVAGELSGMFNKPGQRVEIDMEVDHAAAAGLGGVVGAVEEV